MNSLRLTLKTAMSPASELTLTNKVYLNSSDFEILKVGITQSFGNFFACKNYVFTFA